MEGSLVERRVPGPVSAGSRFAAWSLVAFAAVGLLLDLWRGGVLSEYPNLSPGLLVDPALLASAFLLPAALIIGADRWSGGRQWLLLGAAALVLRAILDVLLIAWFAWRELADIPYISDFELVAIPVRSVVSEVAAAAGFALVAVGLWQATSIRRGWTPGTVILALLGLVALLAGIALPIAIAIREPSVDLDAGTILLYAASSLIAVGVAAAGVSAARIRPTSYFMPELLIAVGAGLAVAGLAAPTALYLLVSVQTGVDQLGWSWVIGAVAVMAGYLSMALGFALGRISASAAQTSADQLSAAGR